MSPLEAEAIFDVISQYRDRRQNLTDCFLSHALPVTRILQKNENRYKWHKMNTGI